MATSSATLLIQPPLLLLHTHTSAMLPLKDVNTKLNLGASPQEQTVTQHVRHRHQTMCALKWRLGRFARLLLHLIKGQIFPHAKSIAESSPLLPHPCTSVMKRVWLVKKLKSPLILWQRHNVKRSVEIKLNFNSPTAVHVLRAIAAIPPIVPWATQPSMFKHKTRTSKCAVPGAQCQCTICGLFCFVFVKFRFYQYVPLMLTPMKPVTIFLGGK